MTIISEALTQQTKYDIDPVCGMTVERAEAREHDLAIMYADREYLFCAPGCRGTFLHRPTAYAVAGRDAP